MLVKRVSEARNFKALLVITNIWGVLEVLEENRHCLIFKNAVLALRLAIVSMTSAFT